MMLIVFVAMQQEKTTLMDETREFCPLFEEKR